MVCGICAVQDGIFDEDEEEVDYKLALHDDPIVGTDLVIHGEHGPGALTATPLNSPPTMTKAQKEKHDLTFATTPWLSDMQIHALSKYAAWS